MKKFIFIAVFSCLLFTCKDPALKQLSKEETPEDFKAFYQKFMTDSSYQMSHIVFPLTGIPDHANPETDDLKNFRWKKSGWTLHKDFDFENSGYDQIFSITSKGVLKEYLIHKSNKFRIERRFSKTNGEWNLIYYAGVNEINNK